jgi:uncharacterized protein Yka (UPF0111/DUF47 family)
MSTICDARDAASAGRSTVLIMAIMPPRSARDTELLELFVASGRNVLHAALLLRELLACWPEQGSLLGDIVDAEHSGDRLAHDILHRLAESGSALDAADVHALACALDDVVDNAEEAADRLALYRIEATMDQAFEIADVLVLAAHEVTAALEALAEDRDLASRLIEIHRLENEADRLVRAAVAELFVDGIDPMVVIRWKDIFDALEAAVDACETVANLLEGVCLRRAHAVV